MVVEHTFVTTLPPTQAMHAASEFLAARGFTSDAGPRAFAVGDGPAAVWDQLQVHRGRPPLAARNARHLLQLPQQVRLEWDRGRVTVAASIADRFKKADRVALLTGIANGLDRLLAQGQPGEVAGAEWAAVEQRVNAGRRRLNVILATVLSVLLLVALAAVAVSFGVGKR